MARFLKALAPKIMSARTHAVIDYIQAGTIFVAAAMIRRHNRRASNAAFVLGAGVLANALLTDYPLGVFRVYDFKTHGMMDRGVAAASAAMLKLPGIGGSREARYFRTQAAAEAGIAAITKYSDNTGARRYADSPIEPSPRPAKQRIAARA